MCRFCLLAALIAAPVLAQPMGEASTFAKTAAPFIDEHTMVVVRVDLARVDVETCLKLFAAIGGENEDVGNSAKEVQAFIQEFRRRGGKDVFVTYGAGDFPHLPCLLIPAPDGADARKFLAQMFLDLYKLAGKDGDWANLHGCACVGPKESLALVKARKPIARPELATALDAGRDGVIQVAFALSAEAKKIHEQVAPTLPSELGGGGIQKITRGMKWMALVVGPGPKMPARWITECTSPEAAHDLKDVEFRAQRAATQFLRGPDLIGAKRTAGLLDDAQTTLEGSLLTTEWLLAPSLFAALGQREGTPADRIRSANNLKQIMIALHNYHDIYGHFPTDIRDPDGRPLLSWRVAILPMIEHDHLYKQFKLDEPWDSEHNRKLIPLIPKTLRSPRQAATLKDRSTYLAPLGRGLMWDEPKGLQIKQVLDGTSNTIALVEAEDDRAVIWSKPEDITIDARNPATGLLGHYVEGFQAAMADGSVRFIKKSIEPATLWALFTRAGGETIDDK
jgi:Protein of unknown function (DUF1559)